LDKKETGYLKYAVEPENEGSVRKRLLNFQQMKICPQAIRALEDWGSKKAQLLARQKAQVRQTKLEARDAALNSPKAIFVQSGDRRPAPGSDRSGGPKAGRSPTGLT